MQNLQPTMSPTALSVPVATAAEAESLAQHFLEVTSQLAEIVAQETELVRAGRLAAARRLMKAKAELSRLYVADVLKLQASRGQIGRFLPQRVEELRRRHDGLRALLQTNLAVLATAHAVSEGIVRGVSGELARKSMPQTYGASGRPTLPGRNASAPLAISRTL